MSSNPTVFGVQLQGLSNEVIGWCLLWVVLYLWIHFVWLASDALQEWRLRQTGTRVTTASAARWGTSNEDSPGDPRQSTLYTWWREQAKHLGHSKKLADDARAVISPWIEQGLPGEIDDQIKARLLTLATNIAVLDGTIKHAVTVLESHRPAVSLARFDAAYRRFARSQNLRWVMIEFGLPLVVGAAGLASSVVIIRHPLVATSLTQPGTSAPMSSPPLAAPSRAASASRQGP